MDDTMGRSSWSPEPPKQAVPSAEERLRSAVAEVKSEVGEVKRDLRRDFEEKKSELQEKGRELKQRAGETLSEVGGKVDGYVSSNPKTVALGALGAGLVVGLIAGVLVERNS